MHRPVKLIQSLIKEIEDLKLDGPDRPHLPQLTIKYEAWYTNALRMVQNLIPERLEDFVSAYKNSRSGPIGSSNYTIQAYLLGMKVNHSTRADYDSTVLFRSLILRQVGILSSVIKAKPVSVGAQEDGLQAEFYTRALDQAQSLFETGQFVPAGVLAATVLENYLRWQWRKRNIRVNEQQRSLTEINDILFKFRTYTQTIWIRIQGLIPIAEACLDPKRRNPSKKEIGIMIGDLKKVLSNGL